MSASPPDELVAVDVGGDPDERRAAARATAAGATPAPRAAIASSRARLRGDDGDRVGDRPALTLVPATPVTRGSRRRRPAPDTRWPGSSVTGVGPAAKAGTPAVLAARLRRRRRGAAAHRQRDQRERRGPHSSSIPSRTNGVQNASSSLRPHTLGRVGMHDGAVAEQPAERAEPCHRPERQPATSSSPPSASSAEPDDLVARHVDPPGVLEHEPDDLDAGRGHRGEVPVDEEDVVARDPQVVVAQVAVDERQAVACQRVGERSGIGDQLRDRRGDVLRHRLGERIPACGQLLGREVELVVLTRDGRR